MRQRERRAAARSLPTPVIDAPRVVPHFSMLSPDDCQRMHQASCLILERTGVMVYHAAACSLLQQAGAQVADELVRIPARLVDWAITSAPRAFSLYQRNGEEPSVLLDGEHVYFGPGSDTLRYLDPCSGERRDFQLADVADCIRLCDRLPEIAFIVSIDIPRDVPTRFYYRHQFAAMIRNTVKPSVFVCNDLADIEAIAAMAAAVVGGMDRLAQRPTLLLYSEPTSPLAHGLEAVDKLLFCARTRIPIVHSPAPLVGCTAPVAFAAGLALGNAEMLSGLVMHQLQNSGAPALYGQGVHHC